MSEYDHTQTQEIEAMLNEQPVDDPLELLKLFIAMDNCNYDLEAMRHSGLFDQIADLFTQSGVKLPVKRATPTGVQP